MAFGGSMYTKNSQVTKIIHRECSKRSSLQCRGFTITDLTVRSHIILSPTL